MDSLVLANQQGLIYTLALCGHWIQSKGPAMSDGKKGWKVKQSQTTPCYKHNLVIDHTVFV